MVRPRREILGMVDVVREALTSPKTKWEERDAEWLRGAEERLLWVLGATEILESPEANVGRTDEDKATYAAWRAGKSLTVEQRQRLGLATEPSNTPKVLTEGED